MGTTCISPIATCMYKYCRDQAREELWLMMGGGAASGVAGAVPIFGAIAFQGSLTVIQAAVVTRIAQVYKFDIVAAGGAGAIAPCSDSNGWRAIAFSDWWWCCRDDSWYRRACATSDRGWRS
jgi:hypothetical protein